MRSKQELRTIYKEKRALLDEVALDDLSIALTNQCLQLDIWDMRYYHLFLPITRLKEINTHFLLTVLQGKDKSVVLSKSDFETGELHHILLEEHTTIKENRWGIPEPVDGLEVSPVQLDVVFVPLLAFDSSGNRVGYGKGFYDRFLFHCREDAKFVGLSLFEPEDRIPPGPGDIPLHLAVTPTRVYRFD